MNMDGPTTSSQPNQQDDVVSTKLDIENEEEAVATMDSNTPSSDHTHNKYAALISNYVEINERLRMECEELKNRKLESKTDEVVSPDENEVAVKELAVMQNLLEAKTRESIANRLEAALWYKATSMFQTECTSRRLLQGMLKHHRTGLTKLKKSMWVEIHFSIGKAHKNDYEAGYVIVKYADSKDAETFNQCHITEIFVPESNTKEITFTIRVSSEGSTKELTFGCETELQRDRWVKSIISTLAKIRETYNLQIQNYTLTLEFGKEKIGLRIKERCLKKLNAEEKAIGESVNAQETAVELGQSSEKETAKAIDKEMKEEIEERPCELMVIDIVDKDLSDLGLKVNSIVMAINEILLVGKLCSEQLKLLAETPKPYMLTFKGRNFKKTTAPLNTVLQQEYFSVLKDLVAFIPGNEVSDAFTAMVGGTFFEQELKISTNTSKTISALLGNQRRLIDLLQDFTAKAGKQQEEQEYKE